MIVQSLDAITIFGAAGDAAGGTPEESLSTHLLNMSTSMALSNIAWSPPYRVSATLKAKA